MEYKVISEEWYPEVIQHLRETFFADEPLNKAAEIGESKELEKHSLSTLRDNLSIMSVTEDNQISGVVLNGVLYSGDIERAQKNLDLCPDDRFKKIFNLLYQENLSVDLFTKFEVDKLFDIRILSVDPRFRGKGIAKDLLRKSEELASERNFKVLKADATGIFSQRILSSQGFEKITEIVYSQYTDESGKPILPVAPPHNKLQLMIKVLN